MKKLYTIALAAAVTLTAAAQTKQTSTVPLKKFAATPELSAFNISKASETAVDFKSVADVAGEYAWNYYGLLSNDSGNSSGVVNITVVDEAAGTVEIEGLFAAGSGIKTNVKGTVDLKAGTLTLANKQDLGTDSYGDKNYFYLKELDDEGKLVDGASSATAAVAKIEGSSFTFDQNCVFAVGDFNDESLGWWKLTAMNSFVPYETPDDGIDLTEWTEFTTATMIDGWVIPVLTYQSGEYADPADFPLSVKVAKNNEDPNLILIENPYVASLSGFPLSSGETGYIVLDITDPEFVLVMPNVYSGYTNGTKRLYCINIESFYVNLGYSKAVIQQALSDDVPEWSTLTEENGNSVITIPTCRFNYPDALDKMYSWTNRADAMKAKFTFKGTVGVNDVISTIENNAPVEYFNLQGQRINNPVAGQLLIKRQGAEVTKVLVK